VAVYSWSVTYIDDTTQRVAALWRAQGDDFLEDHHEAVAEDVERLRTALVVKEDPFPAGWHDRLDATKERLRVWDDAVVDRLRSLRDEIEARKPGAVIDLTGAEPVVIPAPAEPVAEVCGKCERAVDADRLVRPFGDHKPPLCIPCARQVVGFRPRRTR
jgi:hypothetical protein